MPDETIDNLHTLQLYITNLRMAVANGDGHDAGKHVQIPFALVIKQPLHFAAVYSQGLLIVVHMVGRQSFLAEFL